MIATKLKANLFASLAAAAGTALCALRSTPMWCQIDGKIVSDPFAVKFATADLRGAAPRYEGIHGVALRFCRNLQRSILNGRFISPYLSTKRWAASA